MKSRTDALYSFFIFQFLRCVLTRRNICSSQGEPLRCCANNYKVNGTCLECPDGWFGLNCSAPCTGDTYGRFCVNECNCSSQYRCDHVYGCILLSTVPDRNVEMKNNDENTFPKWVWILVVIMIICGSGTVLAIVKARKRISCVDVSLPVTGQKTIEAYSIQRLSKLDEPKDINDDLQYSEIVRDGSKSKYNTDQNSSQLEKYRNDHSSCRPKSNENIYSTHILLDASYDKLQFHTKTDVVLDNELDLYDVTVQKKL